MSSTASPVAAIRDFQRNPLRAGRELRDALHADHSRFLAALLSEPDIEIGNRGFRYAMILLLHNDVLIPSIANPALTTAEQAVRLTRYMLKMDCNFINAMLSALLMRPLLTRSPACTLRVLDIVGEFVDSLGNWRSITRIHQEGDVQIRMKCARLIAQYRFEDPAGLERFCCADPRVRANIIEILWSVDKSRAGALLEAAARDSSNRVAGNAWLALYEDGNARSLSRLAVMLEARDIKQRVTAAWVMGQSRDGRFAEYLLAASRTDIPDLKRTAIASLAKLDPISEECSSGAVGECGPQVILVSAPLDDEFELWLQVKGANGEFQPSIRPVDFFLWSNDGAILDYSLEEMSRVHSVATGVVYPAVADTLVMAFLESIAAQPPGHRWAFHCYGDRPQNHPAATPAYEANREDLTGILEAGPPWVLNAAQAVRNVLILDPKLPERHLVLILDAGWPVADIDKLHALCREKDVRLHCWQLEHPPPNMPIQDTNSVKLGVVVEKEPPDLPRSASPVLSRFKRFWEADEEAASALTTEDLNVPSADGSGEAESAGNPEAARRHATVIARSEQATVLAWHSFVSSLHRRYVVRSRQPPTAVAIRNAHHKPARFSTRTKLLQGECDE